MSPTGDSTSSLPNINNQWVRIFFGNNKFIILPNGSAYGVISNDGISWNEIIFPAAANWVGGDYGNGTYVILSNSSTAATSVDGITWTQRVVPSRNWSSLSFNNNQFVAVAKSSNNLMITNNGTTWTNASKLASSALWTKSVYGNGTNVIFGSINKVAVSTDNANTFTEYPIVGSYWNDLSYINKGTGSGFILIGNGTATLVSSNGISWTQRTIQSNNWKAIQ